MAHMAATPQRRSTPTMPDPAPVQQGHLASARMAVSRAMAEVEADSVNYQKKGFLTLTGLYEALAQPLYDNSLALSTALLFLPEAAMFVVRTTISSIQTGESDYSDFPVASITKKDDIGGLMTFGTRYNVMGLFSFFPARDAEEGGGQPPASTGWAMPAPAAPAPAQQPWSVPVAVPPQHSESVQQAWGQPPAAPPVPPAWPTQAMPPQTGTQRTEPLYQPTQDPSVAPQVLS